MTRDSLLFTRRYFSLSLGSLLLPASIVRAAEAAAEPSPAAQDPLIQEFAKIEAAVKGRLGVAVRDTQRDLAYGYRATERFAMCSTFKLLACAALLARVDAKEEDLARRIRFATSDLVEYSPVTKEQVDGPGMTLAALCEAAMTLSDNTAANLILAALGGPAAVTQYARSLGDAVTRLDRTETELNEASPGDVRDTTSPQAMAANVQELLLGRRLSESSRKQLGAWMLANQTGDTRLRAGVPKNWRVGDKTGSGGKGTTNDVAILWPPERKPLIIATYLTETEAPVEERNAALAAVARVVAKHL